MSNSDFKTLVMSILNDAGVCDFTRIHINDNDVCFAFEDCEYTITVPPPKTLSNSNVWQDILSAYAREIVLNTEIGKARCPNCMGAGMKPVLLPSGHSEHECSHCDGKGFIEDGLHWPLDYTDDNEGYWFVEDHEWE